MSTTEERLDLMEWLRSSLKQLDETSGDQPWTDASSDERDRHEQHHGHAN